jgi:hypothetical protein
MANQELMPSSCVEDFFECKSIVHAYFDYTEDWVDIPLHDSTEMFWRLRREPGAHGSIKTGRGCSVRYAKSLEGLDSTDEFYVNEVWTQRFLPKWVYRAKEHTMICVQTGVDGNRYLQIFSNDKEVKDA